MTGTATGALLNYYFFPGIIAIGILSFCACKGKIDQDSTPAATIQNEDSIHLLLSGQIKPRSPDELKDLSNADADPVVLLECGLQFLKTQQYDSSDYYLQKFEDAIDFDLKPESKGELYRSRGSVQYYLGNEEGATDYFLRSLAMFEQAGDSTGISTAYNNLGNIYFRVKDLPKALDFFLKSAAIKEQIGDSMSLARTFNNLSNVYGEMKEKELSLDYIMRSINIKEKVQPENYPSMASSYNNAAIALKNLSRLNEALDFANKALHYDSLAKDELGMAFDMNALADIHLKRNELLKARQYSERIMAIEDRLESNYLMYPAYQTYAEILEKQGELDKAILALKKSYVYKDSILNQEKNNSLLEFQEKYESEKKELMIAKLKADQEIQELRANRANQSKYTFIVLSFLMALLALLAFRLYRNRAKRNLLLQSKNHTLAELNALKDRLFMTVSHDLKGSISAFGNIANNLLRHIDHLSREDLVQYLKSLQLAGTNVSHTLSNLLTWSKSQKGIKNSGNNYKPFNEVMEDVYGQLSAMLEDKYIELKVDNSTQNTIPVDADSLQIILRNLLSNAVKFSPEGSIIEVKVRNDENVLVFAVKDQGPGIHPDVQKQLFDPSIISNAASSKTQDGNGIGLILVQEAANSLGGTVSLQSNEGEGATFIVRIPMKQEIQKISA